MNNDVNMTIIFYSVSRSKAERILLAAMESAGTVEVSVEYTESIESKEG